MIVFGKQPMIPLDTNITSENTPPNQVWISFLDKKKIEGNNE